MILVTGATGNIGRLLVTLLLERGEDVRALTRTPERAGLPEGVGVVTGDFADVDTLQPAVEGTDAVFLASYGPDTAFYDANVAQVAAAAGARRLVKISINGVDEGDRDPVTEWHRGGEAAIDRVGIPRTFLRCPELTATALWWAESIKRMGKVFLPPFADSPGAPADPLDVAAVAAHCLTAERPHEAEALEVTGPEVLTASDRVARLGEILGVTLECIEVPRDAAFERMTAAGMTPVIANARLDMIEVKARNRRGAVPLDTVEVVTGRRPHTFDDWARRHAGAFR